MSNACILALNANCGVEGAEQISGAARPLPQGASRTPTPSASLSLGTAAVSSPTPSSSSSASSGTDASTLSKSGISGGGIAGAVIGGACGLIIIAVLVWFCRRRRKVESINEQPNRDQREDGEKYVVDETTREVSGSVKPRLHANPTNTDANLPQIVDHQISPVQQARWQEETFQYPQELHFPCHQSAELQGAGYHNTPELHSTPYNNSAELHSPTPRPEMEGHVPPYTPLSYQHQPPTQTFTYEQEQARPEVQEMYPRSQEPVRSVLHHQLSSEEEIAALEEEERRIEAEMEDVKRMKELRDQRYAVQQRLREAKGR